jgi:hypothetical protein
VPNPATTSSPIATGSDGWKAKPSTGTNPNAAIGTTRRARRSADSRVPASSSPSTAPTGRPASSRPAAIGPPSIRWEYGTANASGATAKKPGSHVIASTGRIPGTAHRVRNPRSTPVCMDVDSPSVAGCRRVPRSRTSAATACPAAAAISAWVGVTNTSATPPAANPTSCAFWPSIRNSDRPNGNPSLPRMSGSVAARVPVKIGSMNPLVARRSSSTGIGAPGTAMRATRQATTSSVVTSTSRAGRVRPTPPNRTEPIPIGTNPTANVIAESSGEPVRW